MPERCRLRLLTKNVNVNANIVRSNRVLSFFPIQSEVRKFFKPIRINDAKILKRGISKNHSLIGVHCLGVAVVYFRSKKDLDTSLQQHGATHATEIAVSPYEDELFIDTPKPSLPKPVWDTVAVGKLRGDIKEVGFVLFPLFTLDRSLIRPKLDV